jgi:hypothetical protein
MPDDAIDDAVGRVGPIPSARSLNGNEPSALTEITEVPPSLLGADGTLDPATLTDPEDPDE